MGRLIPSTGDPNPGISAWRVLCPWAFLIQQSVHLNRTPYIERIPSSRMGMSWTFPSDSYKMISSHMTFWPWHILLMVQKSWRNQLAWTKHLKQRDFYHLDWHSILFIKSMNIPSVTSEWWAFQLWTSSMNRNINWEVKKTPWLFGLCRALYFITL